MRALLFLLITGCASSEPCLLDAPGDTITISTGSAVEYGGVKTTRIDCQEGTP